MLRLNQTQVKQLEPHLNTVGALLSPSTGLIDTHSLMLSFLGEAEEQGAVIAFNSPVIGGIINTHPHEARKSKCGNHRA